MARRQYRRRYTPRERFEYHRKRAHDANASEGQRIYSQNWLVHYGDGKLNHEKSIDIDTDMRSRSCNKGERTAFSGSIGGSRARLEARSAPQRDEVQAADYIKHLYFY